MAQLTAFSRRASFDPLPIARTLVVCGCALALIAAGAALPSF